MLEPVVQILMATYNGERFLSEQIESLLAQSYCNWRLLIRDDASTDSTPSILRHYAESEPRRITVIYGENNLGAKANFAKLLDLADSPYVMFCDGDDVWLPEKITKTMAVMLSLEKEGALDVPVLVHTDLRVVDGKLEELGRSFWEYQNSRPRAGGVLNRLLIQNCVTGCTTMLNRALVEAARPVPEEAIMHDWWIALVASSFGHIGIINDQTLLYRQHGGNDTGAKQRNLKHYIRMALKTLDVSRRNYLLQTVTRAQRQANAFLNRFGPLLSERQRDLIEAFVCLSCKGFVTRRATLIKHKIFKSSPISTLGLLLRI